jgi:glutathione S-transferase
MPVMRHGDVELFESKAIAAYLDRRFPGPTVFPSDPLLGALTEQWVSLVNTVIDRTLSLRRRDFLQSRKPERGLHLENLGSSGCM